MSAALPNIPATLPSLLRDQAKARPHKVALRHKRLGLWQSWTWQSLLQQTRRYATALADRSEAGEINLLLLSRPRVEALLLSLAVQSLGGVVQPLDPDLSPEELHALLQDIKPTFVFAESQSEIDILLHSGIALDLVLYADSRGFRKDHYDKDAELNLISLSDLLNQVPTTHSYQSAFDDDSQQTPLHLSTYRTAFIFYGRDSECALIQQAYSHSDLIEDAQHLVHKENLTANEEALAARAFATAGQARYLIAPWLLAGFRLNFPENITTRDNDRRELAPTLVLGTNSTYSRVANLASQKLPVTGSLARRTCDWAIQSQQHNVFAWFIARYIRRVIRENLGFARLKTALLIGEPLPLAYSQFYQNLGVHIRRLSASGTQISLRSTVDQSSFETDAAKHLARDSSPEQTRPELLSL